MSLPPYPCVPRMAHRLPLHPAPWLKTLPVGPLLAECLSLTFDSSVRSLSRRFYRKTGSSKRPDSPGFSQKLTWHIHTVTFHPHETHRPSPDLSSVIAVCQSTAHPSLLRVFFPSHLSTLCCVRNCSVSVLLLPSSPLSPEE